MRKHKQGFPLFRGNSLARVHSEGLGGGGNVQQDNRKLRGVMVGAGFFAGIQLDAWTSVQGAEIAGILDRDLEKAQKLGNKFGIAAYGEWDRLLESVHPDFIDICTPPDSHKDYIERAAGLGLPILCQKPFAPTYEEGEAMVRYCRERGVPLMVNDNWRWQGWYREIARIIGQGLLGNVYTAHFAMRPGDGWGNRPYPLQPYFKEMERFLVAETGVHWIDTFRCLFGEITSLYCQTRTINPIIRGEDLAIIHFNFDGGMTAIYDANRTTYMEEVRSPTYGKFTVEGTDGKLRLLENGDILYTPRGGVERRHPYSIPPGWMGGCVPAALQHFVDGLLRGGDFETSGERYLPSFRAVFACYESARTNQVINLILGGV
jgi:predicted dehydrogenase